jgi:hypothetical protein
LSDTSSLSAERSDGRFSGNAASGRRRSSIDYYSRLSGRRFRYLVNLGVFGPRWLVDDDGVPSRAL